MHAVWAGDAGELGQPSQQLQDSGTFATYVHDLLDLQELCHMHACTVGRSWLLGEGGALMAPAKPGPGAARKPPSKHPAAWLKACKSAILRRTHMLCPEPWQAMR
jgi:hypothetical protein